MQVDGIVAIDPGKDGAIAWGQIDAAGKLRNVGVAVMPVENDEVSPPGLISLLEDVGAKVRPSTVWIEGVGAMPKDGRGSAFTFGYNTGLVTCAAYLALRSRQDAIKGKMELVRPVVWQADVCSAITAAEAGRVVAQAYPQYKPSSKKVRQIAICLEQFPQVELVLPKCRTPHDGIADALCLLEFARRRCVLERVNKGMIWG